MAVHPAWSLILVVHVHVVLFSSTAVAQDFPLCYADPLWPEIDTSYYVGQNANSYGFYHTTAVTRCWTHCRDVANTAYFGVRRNAGSNEVHVRVTCYCGDSLSYVDEDNQCDLDCEGDLPCGGPSYKEMSAYRGVTSVADSNTEERQSNTSEVEPCSNGGESSCAPSPSSSSSSNSRSSTGDLVPQSQSYATVAASTGEWKQPKSKKQRRQEVRTTRESHRQQGLPLKGARKEPLTWMYVGNIEIDDEDNDDSIVKTVRSHCASKDVRVARATVIYNSYNEYVVSCKLSIASSAKNKMLAKDFWPDNIRCREWLKNTPTNSNRTTSYNQESYALSCTMKNDGYRNCVSGGEQGSNEEGN